MSGRRSIAERFAVTYGMNPPAGYSWSHGIHIGGDVVHLQNDADNERAGTPYVAACGRGVAGFGPEWLSGRLCRECARHAGVTDVADLTVDADTDAWMRAQHGLPAAEAVDGDPSSPAVSEPQAQPEPAEITPEIAAGIVQVLGDLERAAIAEIADVPHVVVTVDPEVLASDSGGVRRALPSARGPYPDRASARRAAREIAESLNAAIDGDVPFVCVAVPLATPAGEPWKYALTADTAVTLWAPA